MAGFFFAADFTLTLRVDNFFGVAFVRMSASSGGWDAIETGCSNPRKSGRLRIHELRNPRPAW